MPLETATVTTLPVASTVHVDGGPRPLPGAEDGAGVVASAPDGADVAGAETVTPPSLAPAVAVGEDDVPLVLPAAAPALMLLFGVGAIELSLGTLGVEGETVGPCDGLVVVTSVGGATGSVTVDGDVGAVATGALTVDGVAGGVALDVTVGGAASSLEGVGSVGTTVWFDTTGGAAFAIVRVTGCAGAFTTAGADWFAVSGAGVETRSSGAAACVTVLGSTTGAGCDVEPGASVVGSVPTLASVVAGAGAVPIAIGVPV